MPSHSRRIALVFAVLAGSACHPGTRPANSRATTVAAPARAVSTAGADAARNAPAPPPSDRERVVDEARARVGGAVAVRWPGAGGHDDVVAAIGGPARPGVRGRERMLTWFRLSEPDAPPADRAVPLGDAEITGLAAIDVTGDGSPEMVVFAEQGTLGAVAQRVAVFSLTAGVAQPVELGAESLALDGCATEDDVAARLPLARALAPEQREHASTAALLGRLRFATPAALRASIVAPRGVELCTADTAAPAARRCARLVPGRTPDAIIARELGERLGAALEPTSALGFECRDEPTARCTVAQNGGTRYEYEFAGTGAGRRLARVTRIECATCGE